MKSIDLRGKIQVLSVGNEKTPVIVVDDFSPEIQACIDLAVNEKFEKNQEVNVYYPGVRAPIGGIYGNKVLESIADLVRSIYKVRHPNTLIPHAGYYSLVNCTESELEFSQTVPHFDSPQKNYFAVMHYLNPGEFGGTGFYRHRPTQFENITQDRLDTYLDSANVFIEEHGIEEGKYFTESTDHYELIEKLDYQQNRLVIYPANLLHSAFIDDCNRDLSSDPKTGRLTANFFIYFQ